MKLRFVVLTICYLLVSKFFYSQNIFIQGHVSDNHGNNLFAVSIYLLHQNTKGTVSDLDGKFVLKLTSSNILQNDSLVFSLIGYNQLRIRLDSINDSIPLNIVLIEDPQTLKEIVFEGRRSISREFSIKEMDKMKIYLSPLSSADPLKAVSMLPSSTNTNETANPELRGSTADRTRVFLNGVPVTNPVRNSQMNGIGYFSLFNTELVKSMNVYPSNPPLIYGNTSAGMIDIETEDKLENNNYQISASLASIGICGSKKINNKSFIQLYSNIMFSDGFLKVNPELNTHLKSFYSDDIGLNFHSEISKSFTFNFYNYFVSESSDVLLNLLTWQDHAKAKTIRDFSILNLKYHNSENFFTLNFGTNFASSDYTFGNIYTEGGQQQAYLSFDFKHVFSEKLSLQTGLSNDYKKFRSKAQIPLFYYAMSPNSPTFQADSVMKNNLPEAYFYFRWKPINGFILGFGARKNITINQNHPDYLSLQTNIRYNFENFHSILFSIGKYNNISEPNYEKREFKLLSADQIAFEYLFEKNQTKINIAAYHKLETGDSVGNRNINGIELLIEHNITRFLRASISNTFLNSDSDFQDRSYNSNSNVGFFLVSTLSYFNPKYCNISVAWSTRQGKKYTPISYAIYNPNIDFYEPIYSSSENYKRYGNYNTINMSINKMFRVHNCSLLAFVSIFNLLNTQNPKNIIYNKEYTTNTFECYQKRSIYFGIALSFK